MNNISKPHLVDLLRIFDRMKYFQPRIRYASVRSKPELMSDLKRFFSTRFTKSSVYFISKSNVPRSVPLIHYDLNLRKYFFDGEAVQPSKHRLLNRLEIRSSPVIVHFGHPEARVDQLAK